MCSSQSLTKQVGREGILLVVPFLCSLYEEITLERAPPSSHLHTVRSGLTSYLFDLHSVQNHRIFARLRASRASNGLAHQSIRRKNANPLPAAMWCQQSSPSPSSFQKPRAIAIFFLSFSITHEKLLLP